MKTLQELTDTKITPFYDYVERAWKTWPNLIKALESIEAAGRLHGGPTEAPCGCDQCGAWDTAVDELRKALI